MKYVALLRGINVGGNNKVAMSDVRTCFEEAGFRDVSTYINSGNVLFSSGEQNEAALVERCEKIIEERFGFTVVVMVISAQDFIMAIENAPTWWATDDPHIFRDEVLFVIPPTSAQEVLAEIKKKATPVDSLAIQGKLIFWTLLRQSYSKSVVPKIIGTPMYRRVTIRNAVTTKKLYDLLR